MSTAAHSDEQVKQVNHALKQGLDSAEVIISSNQLELLERYLWLLVKWNKTYNLSAIRDPLDMVTLHLLDSLAVAKHIDGQHFLDVGTGAGLPGIPLALVYPEKSFTLLDSAGKKTRFLVEVKQTLELDNVHVENRRVESFKPSKLFDGIISRAFASLQDMTQNTHHLLAKGGAFWAMKGQYPEREITDIKELYQLEADIPLNVPGLDAERRLLKIVPSVY